MFLEGARQSEYPASDRLQVVKVKRAFLSFAELGYDDRVYSPANDRGFDERTRVEAHHGRTVVERFEVVLLGALVNR